MNLFFLHRLAWLAGIMHCDKHVPKMIVETCQMLSTALMKHTGLGELMPMRVDGKTPYSGNSYPHHPSTKWVGLTRANYQWAVDLGMSLLNEYEKRFGKTHGCTDALHHFAQNADWIPDLTDGVITPMALAMATQYDYIIEEHQHTDRVQAYRDFYVADKIRFAKWEKGTPAPRWWKEALAIPQPTEPSTPLVKYPEPTG